MILLWLYAALFAAAVACGVWRRFNAIQWIWLLAGAAITLVIAWFALAVLFIGPEMIRRGPPGR